MKLCMLIKRKSKYKMKTKETEISVLVNLDGRGVSEISTGVKFLDHMLTSFATHSLVDLKIDANGDLKHHVVEDVALAFGKATSQALGDRKGICRFGSCFVPMDESLAFAAIDLAKRNYVVMNNFDFKNQSIEDLLNEDFYHFFRSFSDSFQCALHLKVEYGSNDHHKAEALFKAFALSFRQAITRDARRTGVPSSKGKI
jgi:imidazoleglycerol phosphate dehydratase HisB